MPRHGQKLFFCFAVIGPLIGLLVAGWAARYMSEIHEGLVYVEVQPENPEDRLVCSLPEGVAPEAHVEPWIIREIQWITSRDVLVEVIARLGLDTRGKMDRKSTYEMLVGNVVVQSVRGTSVVSIRARSSDPSDAGDVARELVGVYEARKMECANRREERMRKELRTAIQEKEEEVDVARMVLAEVERMKMKNINLGSTRTLLHIPESPEHQMARQSLAEAERMLHLLVANQMHMGDAESTSSSRPDVCENSRVFVKRVSPDILLVLTIGAVLGLLLSPLPGLAIMRLPACRKPD